MEIDRKAKEEENKKRKYEVQYDKYMTDARRMNTLKHETENTLKQITSIIDGAPRMNMKTKHGRDEFLNDKLENIHSLVYYR